MDPFTPNHLFPFPIFTCAIAGAGERQQALLAEIEGHRARDPGIRKSNRGAWHSGDAFAAEPHPQVDWVLQTTLLYAQRVLGRYYGDWAQQEIRHGKYWANVVGAGGWNAPHHHFPSHWSGVYYVHVGPTGDGTDDMSGMIEFLNPTPWQAVFHRSGNFALGPRDGMTVLFPSSLYHFVHPHHGDHQRVSIAYNFTVGPKRAADPTRPS